jgi:GTP:adenosylcobinamide-phosphate guanylyltransferase
MDAIVTAGGIPGPADPLYEYTQGGYKALVDIAGKPMIQWVLDALEEAEMVRNITVVGLPEDTNLSGIKISAFIPNQGGMLDNIRGGAAKAIEINPQVNQILTVSSDIPGIRPQMVDWVVKTASETDHDIYYNIITKEVMEERFPTSKRSYIRLKGGLQVCGGDLNVIRARMALGREDIWDKIIEARKSALKQAALVGYGTLFLLLIRMLSVEGAERTAARRLGLAARALICPYAEIGMDVDKPHQLEIMREYLARPVPV